MLKFVFLALIFSQCVLAQKISVDERRKRILAIVDEELAEVNRMQKTPEILLRASELNLEKARLWREVENEHYLAIPPEKRRSVNRNAYFKNSDKAFASSTAAAKKLLRSYPKYKGVGDVYYILGFNARETGDEKDAKKYFQMASKSPGTSAQTSIKSKLASADYFYHDKEFAKAIPLYESSLSKLDEKWWTKDAFNLAWSYYKTRQFDKAIKLMQEIHKKSSTNKYIDVRQPVERDIGLFYVDADRINDAVKFYEGLGINYTEQFIRIAKKIQEEGRFNQAEALLLQAAKKESNPERRNEILLAQLEFYDKAAKIPSHLQVARELTEIHRKQPLNPDQLKVLTYQVDKKAAELQKATTSKYYENLPDAKDKKSGESIAYFALSAQLSPGKKAEKIFFQGETAYAAKKYASSLKFYVDAFDIAKATNDKQTIARSLEGMLSSLAQPNLSPLTADKYYEPVYARYLSVDSKSEKAKTIYVKLFNAQFSKKNVAGAEKTVASFSQNFPSDYKTQEGMLAQVMDYHRKKKDYAAVRGYVDRINSGEFKVSQKYAEALRGLMTKIQIEGVQTSLEKGDKAEALRGYHLIYDNPESTPNAKTNSAYNLAALYHDLGDSGKTYHWASVAIKDMSIADVVKFADSFLNMSSGLFLRQHFAQSSDLSYRVLKKLCKQNSSNKAVGYKNSVFISLANGELDRALEIRDYGKECLIPEQAITEVSLELLKDLGKAKRWEQYERILGELELNSKNFPSLIRPYEDLKLQYARLGDSERARKIDAKQNKFYHVAKTQKLEVPVDTLDLIADKMLIPVIRNKKRIHDIELKFPEAEFNKAVKSKLQGLDQLTSEVNAIQKLGSGKGIVEAYKYVIEAYEDFGAELKAFTPEGKGPEYVESFRKAMSDVYNPILANARKLRADVKKLIADNKILSTSNYQVLYPGADGQKRYISTRSSVLMERGGQR